MGLHNAFNYKFTALKIFNLYFILQNIAFFLSFLTDFCLPVIKENIFLFKFLAED